MVTQLKNLLGKVRRPVIVNGALLMKGRRLVVVGLNHYRVEFAMSGAGEQEVLSEDEGDNLICDLLADFARKYGGNNWSQDDTQQVEAYVDAYTGAVVIETKQYQVLKDPAKHVVGIQYSKSDEQRIAMFAQDWLLNYADLYMYLYNNRIAAQHMPILIKGHLVAGLHQPLIVESQSVISPMSYGENEWFHSMFASSERVLERREDTARRLNLTCIAGCDLATLLNIPVVKELDRKHWMLMCCLVMLSQLNQDASATLTKRYGRISREIMDTREERILMSALIERANKVRTSIGVI